MDSVLRALKDAELKVESDFTLDEIKKAILRREDQIVYGGFK
jgi:hypothetical protein